MAKSFRILVLGAGFSKSAGLPLGPELWQQLLQEARQTYREGRGIDDEVLRYTTYRERCDGVVLDPADVDFEDFLAFLDVEHFLWLQGSDTWSEEGNYTQLIVRRLIGKLIHQQTPAINELPELYLDFARQIDTSDVVLTFNYDRLVELSLEAVGTPYRCFPVRLQSVHPLASVVDTSSPLC